MSSHKRSIAVKAVDKLLEGATPDTLASSFVGDFWKMDEHAQGRAIYLLRSHKHSGDPYLGLFGAVRSRLRESGKVIPVTMQMTVALVKDESDAYCAYGLYEIQERGRPYGVGYYDEQYLFFGNSSHLNNLIEAINTRIDEKFPKLPINLTESDFK